MLNIMTAQLEESLILHHKEVKFVLSYPLIGSNVELLKEFGATRCQTINIHP